MIICDDKAITTHKETGAFGIEVAVPIQVADLYYALLGLRNNLGDRICHGHSRCDRQAAVNKKLLKPMYPHFWIQGD
jgi:hypothetical protein